MLTTCSRGSSLRVSFSPRLRFRKLDGAPRRALTRDGESRGMRFSLISGPLYDEEEAAADIAREPRAISRIAIIFSSRENLLSFSARWAAEHAGEGIEIYSEARASTASRGIMALLSSLTRGQRMNF